MPLASMTRSTNGVVKAAPGMLGGVVLTAGSDAATAVVYDSSSEASGPILCRLAAAANTTSPVVFVDEVAVSKGLYAAVTGTGASVSLYYA